MSASIASIKETLATYFQSDLAVIGAGLLLVGLVFGTVAFVEYVAARKKVRDRRLPSPWFLTNQDDQDANQETPGCPLESKPGTAVLLWKGSGSIKQPARVLGSLRRRTGRCEAHSHQPPQKPFLPLCVCDTRRT